MPTDIYGFFEVRHPHADEDWYGRESWLCMMPLSPLYDGGDYTAFGCLFGVRNWLGWEPVAAGRGLPAEVSSPVRADYDAAVRMDAAIHGATWVSWAELRDLDMSVLPAACGVLRVHEAPGLIRQFRVVDKWPAEVVGKYGVPPVGTSPAEASPGRWEEAGVTFEYGPMTRQDVLGPGTGWEHVFAVMHALAQRFGDDGVRLVVWFD